MAKFDQTQFNEMLKEVYGQKVFEELIGINNILYGVCWKHPNGLTKEFWEKVNNKELYRLCEVPEDEVLRKKNESNRK